MRFFDKAFVTSAVGAMVGVGVSPFVLNAFRIPPSEGFGLDDVVQAAVIVSAITLTRTMFRG